VSEPGRDLCTWRPSWTAARRKRSGTRLGRPHAASVLVCEAINMAARKCPYTTGGDDPPTPGRGTPVHLRPVCRPPGGPRNSPSGRKDRDALSGCPGGSRQAPPSRNERDYQMVHTARSKTVRDVASQVEPDTQVRHSPTPPRGTGHRTRPTRSTEQQDKQPETHPSRLPETHSAAQAPPATLPTPCRAQRHLSQ